MAAAALERSELELDGSQPKRVARLQRLLADAKQDSIHTSVSGNRHFSLPGGGRGSVSQTGETVVEGHRGLVLK